MNTARTILLCGLLGLVAAAVARAQAQPVYKVDPFWPKPLPNKWSMQQIVDIYVDKDDHIWVLTRPRDINNTQNYAALNPPTAECCVAPPTVIEFDLEGNVINSWDAKQGHGMMVDKEGNVWIGSDTLRKYNGKDGKLVAEIPRVPETQVPPGKYPGDSKLIVGGLEEVRADEPAREIYIVDNYLNGRVLVYDIDSLAFKRGWGAYGHKLSEITTDDKDREYKPNGPMPKEFRGHLTLNVSNDGLVYAADRMANRIDVTTKEGKFVKEFIMAPWTGVGGSTGGVMFSPDKAQKYLFISDLTNNHIWFLNRDDGKVLSTMGSMGQNAGQFYGVHMIATDSKGTNYTGEVFAGERVQKYVPVK